MEPIIRVMLLLRALKRCSWPEDEGISLSLQQHVEKGTRGVFRRTSNGTTSHQENLQAVDGKSTES